MSAASIEPGMQIGRYRVIRAIGSGGMGGVFEVEDDAGHRCALKCPIQDVGSSSEATRRFAREANALRVLDHPNLVAAIDVFIDRGRLVLVMEQVQGRTLGALAAERPIQPRRALVTVRQILEGVDHAHARGLVHRDLKPDNVLLVPMGGWERAKIIDFGLVKLVGDAAAAFGAGVITRTGTVSGTPAYIAPEQALGRVVDARADLYAIGVILYELLAGRLPFDHANPVLIMRAHVKQPLPALRGATGDAAWCTPPLVALVERALAKDPAARFASASAMTAALDDAFASLDHI